jgi:DNA-binding IclR family transcriptional regulator
MHEDRYLWPAGRYLPLLVARLHHEMSAALPRTMTFVALCDSMGIPRATRSGLLEALVSQGYVNLDVREELDLTTEGARLAVARLN